VKISALDAVLETFGTKAHTHANCKEDIKSRTWWTKKNENYHAAMQSKLLQARGIIQKASQYLEVTTKFTPIEQQGSELTKRWESI
jgi:hypothetical protein